MTEPPYMNAPSILTVGLLRPLSILAIALASSFSCFSQTDSIPYPYENLLHMSFLRGDEYRQVILKTGEALKLELKNGERKKGRISNIFEDGLLLGTERILFSEIQSVKVWDSYRAVGKPLMFIGGQGVIAGLALAGLGGVLLKEEEAFPIIFGLIFVAGGALFAIYSGVAILVGVIIDSSSVKFDVDKDQLNFMLVQQRVVP